MPSSSGNARVAPQQRVVTSAAALFAENGYAATSVRQIARHAGVALDTVYADGGKAEIFLRAVDRTLSGSADGIPLLEAPGMDAIWNAPTLRDVIAGLVTVTVQADRRAARIWPAFVEGAASDPVLATALGAQHDAMRAESRKALVFLTDRGLIRPDLDVDRTADLIWAEAHPDRYLLLVGRAGWTVAQFSDQLTERILQLLTGPAPG